MAKRFTDTDKWDDEWFMELEPSMKCLWIYICDKCDCAGIWKVNFKKASYVIGGLFDKQSALSAFEGRVIEIGKEKWFIEKFIRFQYPRGLSDASSIHKGVLKSLEYNNIPSKPYLSLIAPTERIKDKDKDKDSSFLISSTLKASGAPSVDEIIQLFNDTLAATQTGKIKFCRGLSSDQLSELQTTLSFSAFQSLDTWAEIFSNVKESNWLIGESSNFVVTLNWLVNHGNALKVLNGQYDGTNKPQNGRNLLKSRITHGNPTGNPYKNDDGSLKSEGA